MIGRTILVLGVLAIAAPASAQSPNTAALVVSVVDQTGAVVPGADVTVVNADTGATRAGTSSAGRNGTYGDAATPLATFGQASRGLANVDSARMVQFQLRFNF